MNWLLSGFPEQPPGTMCSLVLNVCVPFRCPISHWTGSYEKTGAFSVGRRCATAWSPQLPLAVLSQQQPNPIQWKGYTAAPLLSRAAPVLIGAMGSNRAHPCAVHLPLDFHNSD